MATTIQAPPLNTPAQAASKIQNSGAIKQAGSPSNIPEGTEVKKTNQEPAVKLSLTNAADVKNTASAYAPPTKPVASTVSSEAALKAKTDQGPAVQLKLSDNGLKAQAAAASPAADKTSGTTNRVFSAPVNTTALQKPDTPNAPVNEDLKRMMSNVRTQIAEAPKKALEAQANQKPQNVLSLLE